MDSRLSKQIQCSVCLGDFVDPVSLLCDHTFCRQCISNHSQTSRGLRLCPECRRPYTMWDLRSNRVLRNMVDAVREHLSAQQAQREQNAACGGPDGARAGPVVEPEKLVCSDHAERLKLFCETDQKLVCLICRDCEKHQGHKFKPVEEAAEPKKEMLREPLTFMSKENKELEELIKMQTTEITKTEEKSKQLAAQVSAQFEEMHQFLREKEQKVKTLLEKEERAVVEMMQKNRNEIEEKLNRGREEEAILHSVLETDRADGFLQWWIENGLEIVEGMRERNENGPESPQFKSRLKGLSVMPDYLFLGPYETHLQFFVWKEMLGSIKPVPDRNVISDCHDPYLRVSSDGRSVTRTSKKGIFYRQKDYRPLARTHKTFPSGQHYWEVDVGEKIDWSVGVDGGCISNTNKDIRLQLKHDQGYCIKEDGAETEKELAVKPRRIGLYLDCDRRQVCFYNADDMTVLHSTTYPSASPYSLSLSPGAYLQGRNTDPLTVCWN
ncbi:tripartite motif containing 109 isoform X2 [Pygocentrus nattereri]|uniref:Tripartite motif containing 109 n=1 Tax=Pygocentrus nattereri TaxID=42514 RepID=A0A3B4E6D1_PYGNA|nr:tripartite motif containing 109 isoform X2 [Pygocentrus nattereri]